MPGTRRSPRGQRRAPRARCSTTHVRATRARALPAPTVQEIVRGPSQHGPRRTTRRHRAGSVGLLRRPAGRACVPFGRAARCSRGRLLARHPHPPTATAGAEARGAQQRAAWALDVQIAACAFAGGYGVLTENVTTSECCEMRSRSCVPGVPPRERVATERTTSNASHSNVRRLDPENPSDVGVGEAAVGIEAGAHRLEVVPARIARAQRLGGLEVALAPVRAAVVVVHDRLDGAEVRLPCHALEHVDGDVAGRALVRRAQQRVVGRDEPHLDRERHLEPAPRRSAPSRAAPPRRVRSRGSAYSISVKRTSRGEAKMRSLRSTRSLRPPSRVTVRLSCGIRRGSARPARQKAWKAWLVSRTSSRRRARASAAAAAPSTRLFVRVSADVGVREDEELEVVVVLAELVEPLERLRQRRGRVDAAQRERRHGSAASPRRSRRGCRRRRAPRR